MFDGNPKVAERKFLQQCQLVSHRRVRITNHHHYHFHHYLHHHHDHHVDDYFHHDQRQPCTAGQQGRQRKLSRRAQQLLQ